MLSRRAVALSLVFCCRCSRHAKSWQQRARFAHFGSWAAFFRASQPVCCHLHSILFECNACGGNVGLPADCRARLGLCKDNASKRKASGLAISRARLILCKDNASERKASGLAISRVQLILCKGSTNRCNFKMFSSNNRFAPLLLSGSRMVAVSCSVRDALATVVKYAYRGPVLLVSMPFCIAKRPFSPAKTCRSACPHGPFCNLFPVVLQSVEGQLVAETGQGGKRILHRCAVARPMVAWRVWRLAVVPSLFRERLPVCGYVLSALPPCHVLALASASCTSFLVLPLLKMAKHLVDAIKCCIFA